MDDFVRPEESPEPDLRHVWQLVEQTAAQVTVLESTVSEVQRKLDVWSQVTQDGLADLWVKCGAISTEWRTFRLRSAAPGDDKASRCNSRGLNISVKDALGSSDITGELSQEMSNLRDDMQYQRAGAENTDADFANMQQQSQDFQRRLEAVEVRINDLLLDRSYETVQETLTKELARVRDSVALESAKAEAVGARVAQRVDEAEQVVWDVQQRQQCHSAELILLRSKMCMDSATGDLSDEHTTATGSSLQSLPMDPHKEKEEHPRRVEKQLAAVRQLSPLMRKVPSADDSFGCEIRTSAQSTTAPQQRVPAGNRMRGGGGQQQAWNPGQQVPPSKAHHGTTGGSRQQMLSLSQGPLADLQRLVQAATPPHTEPGSISCTNGAAGKQQDQGMLTGLQDALAGVLSSLQQSVHTIQLQMQQQEQQTQGNQQQIALDEGQTEEKQARMDRRVEDSYLSPRERGNSVPAASGAERLAATVCPPSGARKYSPRRNSVGSQYSPDLSKEPVSPRKHPPSPPPEAAGYCEASRAGYTSPCRPLRLSGIPGGHGNTHLVSEPGSAVAASPESTIVAAESRVGPAGTEAVLRSPSNHTRAYGGNLVKVAVTSSPNTRKSQSEMQGGRGPLHQPEMQGGRGPEVPIRDARMMPSRPSFSARPQSVWPGGGVDLNISPARLQPASSRTTWHPSSGFAPPSTGKPTSPHR